LERLVQPVQSGGPPWLSQSHAMFMTKLG